MVKSSPGFWLKELGEIWIPFLNLPNAPAVLILFLSLSLEVTSVNKAGLSSFSLLDICEITVSEGGETSQEEKQIPISIVVIHVWLVPVWELASILMGNWGLITRLEISRDPRQIKIIQYWSLVTYSISTYSTSSLGALLNALLVP